jgi:hypothetical protein
MAARGDEPLRQRHHPLRDSGNPLRAEVGPPFYLLRWLFLHPLRPRKSPCPRPRDAGDMAENQSWLRHPWDIESIEHAIEAESAAPPSAWKRRAHVARIPLFTGLFREPGRCRQWCGRWVCSPSAMRHYWPITVHLPDVGLRAVVELVTPEDTRSPSRLRSPGRRRGHPTREEADHERGYEHRREQQGLPSSQPRRDPDFDRSTRERHLILLSPDSSATHRSNRVIHRGDAMARACKRNRG